MRLHLSLLLILSSFIFYGQQTKSVDFKRIQGELDFDFEQQTVRGSLAIKLRPLVDLDSVFLDAKNLSNYTVVLQSDTLSTSFTGQKLYIKHSFEQDKEYVLRLNYSAQPTKAIYFVNNEGENQIWTQGQGKYTSNWLPSIDDMNDKIEFDLSVVVPQDQVVIANGALQAKNSVDEKIRWDYDMQQPMSSYLVALAIGSYKAKLITAASGVPIELYYYPEDSAKVESTYRYTKEIFDFLETEIGVSYPWQNYKQIPVKDFLYAGMENTTATIFSDTFVVDSTGFTDRNYVNVNAHELAHQWFGDLVTETSGTHHWLQEGFATYYALLAERFVFGDDYYYWQLYQTAEQLKELSDKGKGEKLLNPGASSLTFYQKGAWALHILREQIGDEAFRKAVRTYLEAHKFKNVETEDFITAAEEASGKDLAHFEKDWLNQKAFMASEALQSLKKSPFIQKYLQIKALRKFPLEQKQRMLEDALILPNDFIGQEAVFQLSSELLGEALPLYQKAFDSNNRWVRQAIAISMEQIPPQLKTDFEGLLNDESYVTREQALLKLWVAFPDDRVRYLERMKGVEGFADKNIETLWLALSLATSNYESASWSDRYSQLVTYSHPRFSFEIRQHAFEYLYQLQLFEANSLQYLLEGCTHHNWRFAQSCRAILDMLLEKPEWRKMLNELENLSEPAREFLTKKLQ